MKISSSLRTLALILLAAVVPSQAVTYSLDNGSVGGLVTIGVDGGLGFDSPGLLLNAFQAQPGGLRIDSVQIRFATAISNISSPFDIILFTDPTNDGNPIDGIQAARDSVPAPTSLGVFSSYAFSAPAVLNPGDWFFVGVFKGGPGLISISLDSDVGGGAMSYLSVPGDTLPGTALAPGIQNFMIRAEGSSLVPEPSSMTLLGLGGLALCLLRGRGRRTVTNK